MDHIPSLLPEGGLLTIAQKLNAKRLKLQTTKLYSALICTYFK
jgi:hypothetical protein